MKKTVLIVEDDPDIANLIKLQLLDLDCEVEISHDGLEALQLFKAGQYALVILDIMLPSMDGLDICKAIRATNSPVPIMMLTSKSTELDRVLGLELGADDYLTKPFSVLELVARVKALFRRASFRETALNNLSNEALTENNYSQAVPSDNLLSVGELRINLRSRTVIARGDELRLTAKEFDLLTFFAQHAGQVFTRTQLLDKVWGYGHDGYEHTVNSHINRLRAKVENNPTKPDYILTAWGVGYKFVENL
ncbi:response regulator transcription factor [sulfur-oxidizing endosymbiont of Gigantopelta aegis]|uniref:response regulator transcription factor n=1 Tax=sulfur-oxidizing endosymbiont of Gigantopelta aegis TaxID=2794934 RepID=UPI0018DE2EF9|nr:response regulator transcription factor [sulfur-oxidizing endosymbiont of Gigantopelta aegis]